MTDPGEWRNGEWIVPAPADVKREGPHVLTLVVHIPMHGTEEHKRKSAAGIKRILEVKTSKEVKVSMYNKDNKLIPVDWKVPQ